ncbi:MAG: phosphodiesterase [Candidatus Binatia bacterium]|nr:MAG: phosphodiesterase [Candidatus Binatia bacterium]
MLLIVGWDGASPNIIEALLREGKLPNLAFLRERGGWGRVRAPWPPVTFPSWTTFMTGVNPGRHGIFDFTRRVPGSYRVHFVNATWRRAPSIWKMLSAAGKRVCVLGLPATYPPEAVNGVLLSGFDTPVTTKADPSFMYPPDRSAEIFDLGGFPFAEFQEFRAGPGWYARARALLLAGIEQKLRVAEYFLRQEPWDCFLVLFGESDTVAHHFWHYRDPSSPFASAGRACGLGDVVAEVYQALDYSLGRLLALAPDANVLVISDHGFGGASTTRIYLNRWLCEHGWLRFQKTSGARAWGKNLKAFALQSIPLRFQRMLFRWQGGKWSNALETSARFAGIDFRLSAAFSEELGYFPSIWLNVKGRDQWGVVDHSDYQRVRDDIREALWGWRDPMSGKVLVRNVWYREELYSGPFVEEAPDIILELEEDAGGYAILAGTSGGTPGPSVGQVHLGRWRGGKLQGLSGTHRQDGIFALSGPSIRAAGDRGPVRMEQFAPTILALCGVAPGNELFDGETCAPVVSENARTIEHIVQSWLPSGRVYSKQEEAEVCKRLKDLGYLE